MSLPVENHLPPVELPHWKQPCEQCKADTPTKVLFMKAGLGNACAVCGRLRPFRPYIKKADIAAAQGNINTLKPWRAKGGNHAARIR